MYQPSTGSNAGKANRKRIEQYLKDNPDALGTEIARALFLSLPTVYGHLAIIREEYEKELKNKQPV